MEIFIIINYWFENIFTDSIILNVKFIMIPTLNAATYAGSGDDKYIQNGELFKKKNQYLSWAYISELNGFFV